jgi:predicted DsbA family dithiol-disulfide isomerase
VLPIIE